MLGAYACGNNCTHLHDASAARSGGDGLCGFVERIDVAVEKLNVLVEFPDFLEVGGAPEALHGAVPQIEQLHQATVFVGFSHKRTLAGAASEGSSQFRVSRITSRGNRRPKERSAAFTTLRSAPEASFRS